MLKGSDAGPRPQRRLLYGVFYRKAPEKRKIKINKMERGEVGQGAFQSFEHRWKWKRFNFGASVSYVQVCVGVQFGLHEIDVRPDLSVL